MTIKCDIDEWGTKWWYNSKGQLHREDGPAIEYASGDKFWYLDDKRHREDGPAVEYANGDKEWFLGDERHREDGPAIEWENGSKSWWIDGKRHREDGPACELADGGKYWYLNGVEVTESSYQSQFGKIAPGQIWNIASSRLAPTNRVGKLVEVVAFSQGMISFRPGFSGAVDCIAEKEFRDGFKYIGKLRD
jgi:hypothetical protein